MIRSPMNLTLERLNMTEIPDELKGKLKVTIDGVEVNERLGHFNGGAWMAFEVEGPNGDHDVEYRYVTQEGPTFTKAELLEIREHFNATLAEHRLPESCRIPTPDWRDNLPDGDNNAG